MLLPHDWRDGRGAVRASLAVTDSAGQERELWAGTLRASDRGRPRGVHVDRRVPALSTSLRLRVRAVGALRPLSVARATWLEPAIIDPLAPPIARPPSGQTFAPGAVRRPEGPPLISVLTPVHDPFPQMLAEAIASVCAQSFSEWELCLVDDGSEDPAVIEALRRHAAGDGRIRLVRRDQAGGIAVATNVALEIASGEYIALLDQDDTLEPGALELVARRLESDPKLDMIYTDEDVIAADGRRIAAHLKPGWSPETFCSMVYTCHLGVYRRALVQELGGLRPEFDGTQDYDFVRRLIERTDRIAHIPRVLYHWRAHARSTAGAGDVAKPQAYLAQPRAIAEHLELTGVTAELQFGTFLRLHRIVHEVEPSLTVSWCSRSPAIPHPSRRSPRRRGPGSPSRTQPGNCRSPLPPNPPGDRRRAARRRRRTPRSCASTTPSGAPTP